MALLNIQNVSLGFGGSPLLSGVNLQIEQGEKVCLVGRNGEGKSTLINLINGDILPDDGEIIKSPGLRIATLAQEVPLDIKGTILDVVKDNLENSKNVMAEKMVTRLDLDPDAEFSTLSAGLKRRALLARALSDEPDILLLDEPTNHLDIEAINRLEDFLLRHRGTMLFVSHDRMFLKKIATRIIELDRGKLTSWSCDYETFLKRKNETIAAEKGQNARFDKKLAEEEGWLRQGIKARRTRNEGRVRALMKMREERWKRQEHTGRAGMQIQEAERTGKLVVKARGISFGYEDNMVIRDFSTKIMQGDRVGIIGPNGVGKTTLLGILLKHISPHKGDLRHGTRLHPTYLDQVRKQLDMEKSVQDNVADGREIITVNNRDRHVIGYLKDFLFSPDRARSPAKTLSGGERSRLLLARLFARPSNLLVLDEPTNDLDMPTLELLEELLLDFQGTVLLVSHDRAFLNNVVTSTLVFEGDQKVVEYIGGFDDWQNQKRSDRQEKKQAKPDLNKTKKASSNKGKRKLSYKEQQELSELPGKIETMEKEQGQLYKIMSDPMFYQSDGDEISRKKERLKHIEDEISKAYKRWEFLEDTH